VTGGNGTGPGGNPGARPLSDGDLKNLMLEQTYRQALRFLVGVHPTIWQTDSKRLDMAAKAAAGDLQQFAPVLDNWNAEEIAKRPVVSLRLLERTHVIGGEHKELLRCGGSRDLAKAADVNEVLTVITAVALLTSPLARSLLYAHGFTIGFGLHKRQGDDDDDDDGDDGNEDADE